MKNLLLALIFSLPITGICQSDSGYLKLPLDASNKIAFTNIINVDTTSVQTLYSRSRYFVSTIKSEVNRIELEDQPTATNVISGIYKLPISIKEFGAWHEGYLKYTLTIQSKENRIKYTINDIKYFSPTLSPRFDVSLEHVFKNKELISVENWRIIQNIAYDHFTAMALNLKKIMSTQSDNW